MKKILLLGALLAVFGQGYAQKYLAKKGQVSFYSDAPMEDIEASTDAGLSAINLSNGEVVFSIPIKTFEFEKDLMQEHFNENYMESDKYPKSVFKGIISGYTLSNGIHKVWADGELTIHGVSQKVKVPGELHVEDDKIRVVASFQAALADYKIKVPKVVFYKIAETIDITLDFNYEKHEE